MKRFFVLIGVVVAITILTAKIFADPNETTVTTPHAMENQSSLAPVQTQR